MNQEVGAVIMLLETYKTQKMLVAGCSFVPKQKNT